MYRHRRAVLAVLAALLLSALPQAGLSHADLVSAIPAGGATVSSELTELRLKFQEPVELDLCEVKLTSPTGDAVETGKLARDPNDETVLVVPLSSALPDGEYQVSWKVVSADMHKIEGSYSFKLFK